MKNKTIACALSAMFFLSGCMEAGNCANSAVAEEPVSASLAMVAPVMAAAHEASLPVTETSADATPFSSDIPLSLEDTIRHYFKLQYLAYTTLKYTPLDHFLDMAVESNQNLIAWTKALLQRRRLLKQNGLCYVDTTMRPYEIIFDRQPEDAFFSRIRGREVAGGGDTAVYFHITGNKGEAYSPIMAINAQHTMILKQVNGHWKITMHYFPGAVRKYLFGAPKLPSEAAMLADLKEEFAANTKTASLQVPASATAYSHSDAVAYAMSYTEEKNPAYYDIGDMRGNCANFVSQCLSAGLSDRTTSDWFGGSGGGAPAWETVRNLWDFLSGTSGIQGQVLTSPTQLAAGDVTVTKSLSNPRNSGGYNHILMVVDGDTLKLAQNSPACFVYWSDLFDVEYGLFRPEYLE